MIDKIHKSKIMGFEKYFALESILRFPVWELKKSRLFVVSAKDIELAGITTESEKDGLDISKQINDRNIPIDLPFKNIILEVVGSGIYSTPITANGIEICVAVYSVACVETSPGNYIFEAFGLNTLAGTLVRLANIDDESDALIRYALRKIFNRTKLVFGEESNSNTICIKKRTGKEWWKVSPVIHISLEKCGKFREPIYGEKIDWKHTWEVRGHWRKTSSIGKDRDGKYTVSGYTWVKDHKKGDGKLVEKIRVTKITGDNHAN